MFTLLSTKAEQEKLLLSALVNKLVTHIKLSYL
jgi:hypothetical protein